MIGNTLKSRGSRRIGSHGRVGDYIRALASKPNFGRDELEGCVNKAGVDSNARRALIQALLPEVVAVSLEWHRGEDDLQRWIEYGNRTLCRILPGLCVAQVNNRPANFKFLRSQVRGALERAFEIRN